MIVWIGISIIDRYQGILGTHLAKDDSDTNHCLWVSGRRTAPQPNKTVFISRSVGSPIRGCNKKDPSVILREKPEEMEQSRKRAEVDHSHEKIYSD